MKTILKNNNYSNFGILATFARSFDNYHTEQNKMHLITSVCLLTGTYYDNFSIMVSDSDNGFYRNFFIMVEVYPVGTNLNYNYPNVQLIEAADGYRILITIDKLFFILNNNNNDIINTLFGDLQLKAKNNNISSPHRQERVLFVFHNITWSNVLLYCKIHNINISGGSISKRHSLHTVDIQLTLFLIQIFGIEEIDKIKNLVYNSFNNLLLSSEIPINLYDQYINIKKTILNLTYEEFYLNYGPLLNEKNSNLNKEFSAGEKIIISNFKFCFDIFKNDILNSFENDLDSLKIESTKLGSKISSLSLELSRINNINSISTVHMRNKDKKKFKKERSKINKDKQLLYKINTMEHDIENYNSQKNPIDNLISKKQIELDNLLNNINKLTLFEMKNLYLSKVRVKSKIIPNSIWDSINTKKQRLKINNRL